MVVHGQIPNAKPPNTKNIPNLETQNYLFGLESRRGKLLLSASGWPNVSEKLCYFLFADFFSSPVVFSPEAAGGGVDVVGAGAAGGGAGSNNSSVFWGSPVNV